MNLPCLSDIVGPGIFTCREGAACEGKNSPELPVPESGEGEFMSQRHFGSGAEPEEWEPFFDFIYTKYKDMMLKIAENILHDPALAEDAVQEAFLKLMRNLHQFNGKGAKHQKNYLIVLTRHTAIDLLRKKNREKLELIEDSNSLDYMNGRGGNVMEDKQDFLKEKLYDAVIRLPDRYRDVFTLKYQCGYSDRDIAGILDISAAAVRKRISRGKKLLKTFLDEESDSA